MVIINASSLNVRKGIQVYEVLRETLSGLQSVQPNRRPISVLSPPLVLGLLKPERVGWVGSAGSDPLCQFEEILLICF
jgi:hypothetical protein